MMVEAAVEEERRAELRTEAHTSINRSDEDLTAAGYRRARAANPGRPTDTEPRLAPRICALETGTSKTIRTAIAQRPRRKQIIAPPGLLIVKSASRQSPTGRSPDCVANAYGTFSPSSASFSPLWTVFS